MVLPRKKGPGVLSLIARRDNAICFLLISAITDLSHFLKPFSLGIRDFPLKLELAWNMPEFIVGYMFIVDFVIKKS